MKNNKFSSLFKEWYEGNLSFDERMNIETEKPTPKKEETKKEKIRLVKDVENAEEKLTSKGYKFFSVIFCVILAVILVGTVNFMPLFADDNTPTTNEVYEHYVGEGRDQTGAVNTVAGMILDYRAFDTLGESFVLFNGHLSPGGGFSGGSVLGAGFILFAMAYGEDFAAKIITQKIIRVITICSLSFYCLAKSYSFFTGNEFNGIHSIITPGTPGNIVSGGLILPLNIAVGFVVCCTMYSFYMIFKRGRLD